MDAQAKNNPLVVVALILVLAFGSLAIWYPKATQRKQVAEKNLVTERQKLDLRKRILASAKNLKVADVKLPSYAEERVWLQMMDTAVTTHKIEIAQRSTKEEDLEETNGVGILAIECPWEGRLDSFVWFAHELETRKDAKMSFATVSMQPSRKNPGLLQGKFKLNCAYTPKPISE